MHQFHQISCQISLYPLGQADYNGPVDQVLDLVRASGLEAETNGMATIVRGESGRVFKLLEAVDARMADQGIRYVCTSTLSNVCGCPLPPTESDPT
ncbi:hypothetical protein CRD60_04210 [Bifidobacterium aemilianum]|uniref:Thiamin/hydroxymethyl pyrimidine-binding YkoF putative domain-containing protein n=1 Tax=Bifidobacterium aemilianum TaxID=2493120 RepID=A0A366K7U5_9BIFI|nr:YkoF family thiamine/hydroxymethylpyrimidine-binding protein [Bifidobacterium aemilianum]RBP97806.1 hypothetical protein CRD60_04210 [Bifidobacterium aemilianum]